jgi:DNA-binding beta-propeller fold protein YncE
MGAFAVAAVLAAGLLAGCGREEDGAARRAPANRAPSPAIEARSPASFRAFVALEGRGAVAVLDSRPRWHVARRTRVAGGPHNLEVSPDGRFVAVTSPPAGRVTVFDATGRRVADARVPGMPHDLVFTRDSGRLWITVEGGGRLVEIAPRTGRRVRDVPAYGRPHDLALSGDGRRLWVTLDGSDSVQEHSAGTGRLLRRHELGGAPHDLAFDPSGRRVWLSNTASSSLTVAAASGRKLGSMAAGTEPHHFVFGLGRLWASDHGGGTVMRIDPRRRRVLQRTSVGPEPHHLAVAGAEVLVAVHGSGRVVVLSRRGRLLDTVSVGAGPHGIGAARAPR